MRFLAITCLSSGLPDRVLVPVSVPILVVVLLSAFSPVSISSLVPVSILCFSTGLHPCLHPCSRPVPVPILRLYVCLHHRSYSVSRSVPITVYAPVLAPDPVAASVSAPDPARSLPSLRPSYLLGTMPVYRPRFVCVSVCVYVYLVEHNRAIQPWHPSNCIPLVFVIPRRYI